MSCFKKYPYSPTEGFLVNFVLPPFQFSFVFSIKNLAFKAPLPLGISNHPPGGGYGYFIEPHNIK